LFTSDGDSVFSPVGNRISQFDLKRCVLSVKGVRMSPRVLSRAGTGVGRTHLRTAPTYHVLQSALMASS